MKTIKIIIKALLIYDTVLVINVLFKHFLGVWFGLQCIDLFFSLFFIGYLLIELLDLYLD